MKTTNVIEDALQQAYCAQSNLKTFLDSNPFAGKHPLVQIVQMQIENVVQILEGKDAGSIMDHLGEGVEE